MPNLGYCTNVHAGATLDEMRRNLDEHAVAVKRLACPHAPLPIGLWLSAAAAAELAADPAKVGFFGDWLGERGLVPFTFNGFPYGNFHEPVVKQRVYEPAWDKPLRVRYTLELARILAALLPEGADASISTLPIGWRCIDDTAAAANLREVAAHLARLEDRTGRRIHVDLEPEPCCILSSARDAVRWFEERLLTGPDADRIRRHIGVCHDVCHAAVVFDDQAGVFAAYDRLGVRIGKVQISSAVRCDLGTINPAAGDAAIARLAAFREDRYLHQTFIREPGRVRRFDDLPDALNAHAADPDRPAGEWRTHFHVPVYLDRIDDLIGTTQSHIAECIRLLRGRVEHWEVETYAWNVLPSDLRTGTLAEGIAAELAWAARQFETV